MFNFLMVLIFIVCVLLVLVILVQESKGGGLASGFSSSSQVMGVKSTADFLERSTWGLAIALLVLSLATTAIQGETQTVEEGTDEFRDQIENEVVPTQQPNLPTAPNQ